MSSISNEVAKQQERAPSLAQLVENLRPQIARALPKHMDADRMTRLALTVLRRTPALGRCTPESFLGALMTCSQLGLEPGIGNEAHLVPYKGECQLIVGYAGLAKLFYQSPLAKHLDAQAVHVNDEFDYAYGLAPYLVHKPARSDRGDVIAYYAAATLTTGGSAFLVLSPEEVRALRGGKVGTSGGIADPQHWMERKTVLRQLLKTLPKSTTLMQALAVDETIRRDPRPEAIDLPAQHVDTVTGEVQDADLVDDAEPAGWDGGK